MAEILNSIKKNLSFGFQKVGGKWGGGGEEGRKNVKIATDKGQ